MIGLGPLGCQPCTPNQLRYAVATSWLAEGGNENEPMLVAGCKSRTMIDRGRRPERDVAAPRI